MQYSLYKIYGEYKKKLNDFNHGENEQTMLRLCYVHPVLKLRLRALHCEIN